MSHRASLLPPFALALVLGQPFTAAAQPELHHQDRPEASPILAYYDFEEPTPSGPDTYWLRAQRGASVDLSVAFRANGERSLHLSEVPGNRDFAEFGDVETERALREAIYGRLELEELKSP